MVSGTTVAATANTRGATEWRWSWGDGTATAWTPGCAGYAPTHTYATTGTYTVRLEARSCRSGPVSTTVTVGVGTGTTPLSVDRFAAVCPEAPFCSVAAGEPLAFETLVSGAPEAYLYDWNGDGLADEVATAPVPAHTYSAPGIYTPRVTVFAGTSEASASLEAPLEVVAGSGFLFSHDFESGDLSGWEVP